MIDIYQRYYLCRTKGAAKAANSYECQDSDTVLGSTKGLLVWVPMPREGYYYTVYYQKGSCTMRYSTTKTGVLMQIGPDVLHLGHRPSAVCRSCFFLCSHNITVLQFNKSKGYHHSQISDWSNHLYNFNFTPSLYSGCPTHFHLVPHLICIREHKGSYS